MSCSSRPLLLFPCRVPSCIAVLAVSLFAFAALIPGAKAQQPAPSPTPAPAATPTPPPTPTPAQTPAPAPSPSPAPPPLHSLRLTDEAPPSNRVPPPSTSSRRPDWTVPEPVYNNRNNFLYQGATDLRLRSSYGDETNGTYIAAVRVTGDYVRADSQSGLEKAGARVQLVYETQGTREVSQRALRFGELYGFYRFRIPGVTANVKVGQFVLPFGLAAAYDSSMLPIHSLYDKSLGLRIDTGAMMEGEYGIYHYAASVSDGSGPNRRDYNDGRIWAFRLERIVDTDFGRFQVGGSLLSGRGPVTDFDTELPPSGTSSARDFMDITRFAGDGQYQLRSLTARGEVVFGADDNHAVWGYFAEGDYRFLPRVEAVLYSRTWNFPVHPQQYSSSGIGLNYHLRPGVVLRGLYEYESDTPLDGPRSFVVRRFTLQTRLTF